MSGIYHVEDKDGFQFLCVDGRFSKIQSHLLIIISTDFGIVYDHLKRTKKVESRIEAERKAFGDREERVSFLRGSARVVTFAIIRYFNKVCKIRLIIYYMCSNNRV